MLMFTNQTKNAEGDPFLAAHPASVLYPTCSPESLGGSCMGHYGRPSQGRRSPRAGAVGWLDASAQRKRIGY